MRIGKTKKIVQRPDVIPVVLPKPPKRIKVSNWPTKRPESVPVITPARPPEAILGVYGVGNPAN